MYLLSYYVSQMKQQNINNMKTIQIWNDLNWGDDNELTHEYDLIENEASEDGKKYELRRSHSGQWTNPGELVLSIIEDVDEDTYTIKFGKQKMILDCSELYELFAVFGYIENSKLEYRLATPIKTIN